MLSIYDQFFSFLVTILIGFLAGILFDFYRVIRGLWRPRKVGTFIGDFIFWILLTFVVFIMLLFGNWGELRIYVLLGITLGYIVYARWLSLQGQKVLRITLQYFMKAIKKLWWLLTWPIKTSFKIIVIPVGFIVSGLVNAGMFSKRSYGKLSGAIKSKIKNLFNKQPLDKD